jgi:hypothetical protein
MTVTGEPEEEERAEEGAPNYSGIVVLVTLLPLFFAFEYIGKTDMGLNLCICLGVNLLAIRMRWDLRKHAWFWGTALLVIALELPWVLRIPWPRRWIPGIALLPIGLVGFAIATGAFRLVEKFILKGPPNQGA